MNDVHAAVPAHLEALLADLVTNQKRLRSSMNEGMAASDGAGANPKHIAMGVQLTKATIDLSRELRAWAKATKETSKNLSISERLKLVAAFIQSLSVADKRELEALLAGEG